uniref:Golgin A2 n=1 Tax=Hypotaenidia okinawae TaxID=2861861 RepID=A0A6G1RND6_9GRUI
MDRLWGGACPPIPPPCTPNTLWGGKGGERRRGRDQGQPRARPTAPTARTELPPALPGGGHAAPHIPGGAGTVPSDPGGAAQGPISPSPGPWDNRDPPLPAQSTPGGQEGGHAPHPPKFGAARLRQPWHGDAEGQTDGWVKTDGPHKMGPW